VLFKYLTNTATTVAPSADFSKAIPAITGDTLTGATNLSYAYGIWVYVQNWDPASQKTIFYRKNNIQLFIDPNSPILMCRITLSDNTVSDIKITNSFPLQKWVHIIVSVDNQFVDCYLDGKLVVSQQVMKLVKNSDKTNTMVFPKQPLDSISSPLYLGNSGSLPSGQSFLSSTNGVGSGWSCNALLFTHWSNAVDPQTAWDWYMKGNGKSRFSSLFGAYGVNYTVLKDNIAIVNNQPLF